MGTTKLINCSKVSVEIKEGNAGVYSKIGDVAPGHFLILTLTEHATYREYWCAMQPNATGENVILTSDDCVESEEVEIYINSTDEKLAWRSHKRRTNGGRPTDANIIGLVSWFAGFFKKTPKATQVNPPAPQ